ncbi:MAG: phytanoyl-CoA dioxygenase family protein [Pseudomonadales bacterium]
MTEPVYQLDEEQQAQLARDGFCRIPGVLSATRCRQVRQRLVAAAEESRRRGVPTYIDTLDPNDRNVRVFNLLDLDPVFQELIRHPVALTAVRHVLGDEFLISNFTANIALPGSRSMGLHSDQSLVMPEPWIHTWTLNVIWCLDRVHETNGATRYVPGSHRCTTRAELPANAAGNTSCFEADAGDILLMEGRLWHTSGCNTTADEERALLFGYYCRDFIRPQVNWNAQLSPATQAALDEPMRAWLGLGPAANVHVGAPLIRAIFD